MSKRVKTQVINTLKRNRIQDPYSVELGQLLRLRGIGPLGVAWLAKIGYPTCPQWFIDKLMEPE